MDKDFNEIMGSLSPATRKRFQKASEVKLERLPMPSIAMTQALEGGIGHGRITLLWGNKSSGKTSLALQAMADAQKEGKTCAFLDGEKTFDPSWATRLGVKTDDMIYSKVTTIADFADMTVDLIQSGVDIITLDSITPLIPQSWMDKGELKGLDGTKQIGSKSKDWKSALTMVNSVNETAAVILISQVTNSIGTYGAVGVPDGGNAMKFFSTTVLKVTSSASDKEQIKGQVQSHDKIFEANIGRSVEWQVQFNKIGPSNRNGNYDFYYGGEDIGIDLTGEIVDLAVFYGIIEKGGAWFTYDGQQYQGRKKMVQAIKEQPDLRERLVKELK